MIPGKVRHYPGKKSQKGGVVTCGDGNVTLNFLGVECQTLQNGLRFKL